MPLVKIDLIKDQGSPDEIKHLADIIQEVLIDKIAALKKDRYQIITQHEPYELICQDTGLGTERPSKLVFIQIFQQGRSKDQKQAMYGSLAENLRSKCGVDGNDLIISCSENTKEDWSFGFGESQFLTGDL
ncbi:hypothetical protein PMZ80_007954 [Knufia obscura]|uniref:Tautomerase n=2 Tax=Knufia TaxID=430999 RepID=A0AAN8EKA1_9EURO|nr:hypothetical protein PMZ80_007954 [Knufia obscura]KAK5957318.1 hypothetical protein OHC33_001690 [Knufia fluminis]